MSPTLGFTHLQFEALLTAARQSSNRNDFALLAMLGLLGLRIFEATSTDISDLGEEHGHRVLRVGGKVVLVPLPPAELTVRPWLAADPVTQDDLPFRIARTTSRSGIVVRSRILRWPTVGGPGDYGELRDYVTPGLQR